MRTNDFEFDLYGELLHWGNRQDRELTGDGTDEDWYSWEAVRVSPGAADIIVYGSGIPDQQFHITWEKTG